MTKEQKPKSRDIIISSIKQYKKDVNHVYVNAAMVITFLKTNRTRTSFNRTVDYCAYLKKKRTTDWFFTIVFETIAASEKSPHQCPILNGTLFTIDRFEVRSGLIPAILNIQESTVVQYFNFWTKVKKNYVNMISYKVFGGFRN